MIMEIHGYSSIRLTREDLVSEDFYAKLVSIDEDSKNYPLDTHFVNQLEQQGIAFVLDHSADIYWLFGNETAGYAWHRFLPGTYLVSRT